MAQSKLCNTSLSEAAEILQKSLVLHILAALGEEPMRFKTIQIKIEEWTDQTVSSKMLAQRMKQMSEAGLIVGCPGNKNNMPDCKRYSLTEWGAQSTQIIREINKWMGKKPELG